MDLWTHRFYDADPTYISWAKMRRTTLTMPPITEPKRSCRHDRRVTNHFTCTKESLRYNRPSLEKRHYGRDMPYIDRFSCSRRVFATLPIVFFGACAPLLILLMKTVTALQHPNSFYGAMGEACCGEDPHPVHGISAPDGSFILGGKSIDGNGNSDGFIVKIGPTLPTGMAQLDEDNEVSFAWSDTFGVDGKQDAVNAVAASEDAVGSGLIRYRYGHPRDTTQNHLDTGSDLDNAPPSRGHRVEPAFESIVLTPEAVHSSVASQTANRGRLKDLNPTETRPVVVRKSRTTVRSNSTPIRHPARRYGSTPTQTSSRFA